MKKILVVLLMLFLVGVAFYFGKFSNKNNKPEVPVERTKDILDKIVEWTAPMVWSEREPNVATYRLTDESGNLIDTIKLTGYSIESAIGRKEDNKLSPLLSSDSSELKNEGFIEDMYNSAGGPMGMLFGYKKVENGKTRVLVVTQMMGTHKVFYSDPF